MLSPRTRRAALHLYVGLLAVLAIAQPGAANAATEGVATTPTLFNCNPQNDEEVGRKLFRARNNLATGLIYFGASGAVALTNDGTPRWRATNSFDTSIRSGLRINSRSGRRTANLVSDVSLIVSFAALPLASMGSKFLKTGDCAETWDMAGDFMESVGLSMLVTQTLKSAVGRDRPFGQDCDSALGTPAARCNTEDRFRSFFSGHASLAATGAGLTCSYSVKREAWGSSTFAKAAPCALGVSLAAATSLLRISSDKHWGTDVMTGFAVGMMVGYFDTWSPLDLLKFETRDTAGRVSSRGVVLPSTRQGRYGFQLSMTF